MKLRDYFRGIPVSLRSPLPPEIVAERINQSTPSWWSFIATGVSGYVRFGHLRLFYRGTIFEYNAMPLLAGRLRQDMGGSVLQAKYRAPQFARVFFPMWYGFIALFTSLALFGGGMWEEGGRAILLIMMVVFIILPIAMHYIFTSNSDRNLRNLVEFLEMTADFAEIPDADWTGGRRI